MGNRKRKSASVLKEDKKAMAFAKLNNCPTSPRKMRLVADQVRGESIEKALSILKFSPKKPPENLKNYCYPLCLIGNQKMKTKT